MFHTIAQHPWMFASAYMIVSFVFCVFAGKFIAYGDGEPAPAQAREPTVSRTRAYNQLSA